MKLDSNEILPSQSFLKPDTVRHIFDCINLGRLDDLPPDPIVRRDKDENYVVVDGHNLLAIRAYLNQSQEVHVAESKTDGLPDSSEQNRCRNLELAKNFEICLDHRDEAKNQGITSFRDLLGQYPELFPR